MGLAYYVYVLTGSTLASALMLLASFVPQIALSSLAGVFVDRWDRKRTMVVANLLLAAGLLPLLAVQRRDQVWIIYVVVAAEGCVQQFFTPAEQALIPRLVADDAPGHGQRARAARSATCRGWPARRWAACWPPRAGSPR